MFKILTNKGDFKMVMEFETLFELEVWYESLKLDIYYMEEELEITKEEKDYFRMDKLHRWIQETEYLVDEYRDILNCCCR